MREIKFRGKDIETGEWIYGHFFQRLGHYPTIVEPRPRDGKVMYYEIAVEDTTVGQFTGVYDANWEEIYEGDVLREIATDRKVVVIYDAPQFCFEDNDFGYGFLNLPENFVVIGNIHDNPELQIIMSKSQLIERYGMDKNR